MNDLSYIKHTPRTGSPNHQQRTDGPAHNSRYCYVADVTNVLNQKDGSVYPLLSCSIAYSSMIRRVRRYPQHNKSSTNSNMYIYIFLPVHYSFLWIKDLAGENINIAARSAI